MSSQLKQRGYKVGRRKARKFMDEMDKLQHYFSTAMSTDFQFFQPYRQSVFRKVKNLPDT